MLMGMFILMDLMVNGYVINFVLLFLNITENMENSLSDSAGEWMLGMWSTEGT